MRIQSFKFLIAVVLSAFMLASPWAFNFPGWLLGFAFVPLLWIEDSLAKKASSVAFLPFCSWAFLALLGWNLLATWWICYVSFGGMLLIAVLNALVMTIVWSVFHWAKKYFSRSVANLFFVSGWVTLEFLQMNWQLAWPWLNLGNGLGNVVKWAQWYEYSGPLGGTLWLLVVNFVAFRMLRMAFRPGRMIIPVIGSALLFLLVVIGPYWWSASIYHRSLVPSGQKEVIVLQPDVDPYTMKFNQQSNAGQQKVLLHLTDSLLTANTGLVISPETALPLLHEGDSLISEKALRPFLNRLHRHPSLLFILGAITRIDYSGDWHPSAARTDDRIHFYDYANTSLFLDSSRNIQIYHKRELVNGVEKIPFPGLFSFLKDHLIDLGGVNGSLVTNDHPVIFRTADSVGIIPVICFESAFGNYVAGLARQRGELIVVQTNDGWWRDSAGALQHLNFARLRAIENRKELVQSANTGISALIDQRGDILEQTGLDQCTALRGTVKLYSSMTFYSRYGDYLGRIAMLVAVLLMLYFFTQRRIQKSIKNPH